MSNKSERTKMLEDIIAEPCCFPGGYEKVAVITDGGILCAECVKKDKERIMSDVEDGYNTGWLIDAVCLATGGDIEEQSQDDSFCDNCNKMLGELFS